MARQERPRRSTSMAYWLAFAWTCWWAVVTVVMIFLAVSEWTGLNPARDNEAAMGGVFLACVGAALTAGGGVMMARTRDEGPAAPPVLTYRHSGGQGPQPARIWVAKRDRLPRPGSGARSRMRQLDEAEGALAELLRRLREVQGEPAEHVVDHVWEAAIDAATSLRSIATRVEVIELAAEQTPPGTLDEAVSDLLRQLDEGLDAYRGLILAAGQVVLEGIPVVETNELAGATESLAALASALRDLSK